MKETSGQAWISGWGASTTIGRDSNANFSALLDGKNGLSELEAPFDKAFRSPRAYEFPGAMTSSAPGRAGELLNSAVSEALAHAGVDEKADLAGIPVVVGTGLGETRTLEAAALGNRNPPNLDLCDGLRERWGMAPMSVFSNACAASLYALGLAADLMWLRGHDMVVVGGVDVISLSMFGSLDRVQGSLPDRVRPFDSGRTGVLMGEGAAAVVLSRQPTEEHVRLAGVGLGCDAVHVTAPDPVRIEQVMRDAHALAGVSASDIDLVIAHGTGTPLNDHAEGVALANLWSGSETRPLITALKGSTGHTSGGSGLFSLVIAINCLLSKEVPPIVGLTEPDEGVRGLRLARERVLLPDTRFAQVNAFGFGGLNAVAVIEHHTAEV